MALVRRILRHPDGREEVFTPHRDDQERYVLATKTTNDPIHHASNQVFTESESEMIDMLRTGKYYLRMNCDGKPPANLIAPESIEIID